ncbi:MAG TPA: WD40 repeat domain-containing protein [Gemmataceae bacterium]|jgi:WD40 repeat protein|nr:WD40 repeat domain-containing protein [Gemmataceae bacterium]
MPRFVFCLLTVVLPASLIAAEKPIVVVQLDRKDPIVYEKDIEPIFRSKCVVCHTGKEVKGKFDVSSYVSVMKGSQNGPVVLAGKSAESPIVLYLGKTKKPFMPPKDEEPLTPQELALIKLWIDQGAKPPSGSGERPKIVLHAPPAGVVPVRAVAVSYDKSTVAASRGNQIHIYDAGSGTFIRTLIDPKLAGSDGKTVKAAHLALVESLAFSPDGKFLASGSFQEVIIWDVQTGAIRHKLTGFADRVVALAFSGTGNLLATGGGPPSEDGEVKVYDAASGKLVIDLKSPHSDTVYGVCFSPDGKMLASCGADKFVKVFEVPSGKFIKSFEGHTHHVLDVGWKADGKLLASAGADNVIKIWTFETGEQARTIQGHTKQITRLEFLGTTPQIITCSGDQTVRMWNVDNGGTVRQFTSGSDFLYGVGVSPDGAIVAAGGEDGIVRLFNGANGSLIKQLLPPGVELPKK